MFDNTVPMTWTNRGHIPTKDLILETVWEGTDDYVKVTVNHLLKGVVVRNDVYVYSKRGITGAGEANSF